MSDLTTAYRAALREAKEIRRDDLQAASDMYGQLTTGTFYTAHDAAVAENIARHAARRIFTGSAGA